MWLFVFSCFKNILNKISQSTMMRACILNVAVAVQCLSLLRHDWMQVALLIVGDVSGSTRCSFLSSVACSRHTFLMTGGA